MHPHYLPDAAGKNSLRIPPKTAPASPTGSSNAFTTDMMKEPMPAAALAADVACTGMRTGKH